MRKRKWIYDDGGRAEAGYKGDDARDCVTRAIAIATELPYRAIYDALNVTARTQKGQGGRSNSRLGVYRETYEKLLVEMGWTWVATMGIGTGCTVHLKAKELPSGRIICKVSSHLVAVIDGVIHDTHDSSTGWYGKGKRCVYGYYLPPGHPDATLAS